MERFKIITNKTKKYPMYYLIDSITGGCVAESENLASLKDRKKLLDEWHEYL